MTHYHTIFNSPTSRIDWDLSLIVRCFVSRKPFARYKLMCIFMMAKQDVHTKVYYTHHFLK